MASPSRAVLPALLMAGAVVFYLSRGSSEQPEIFEPAIAKIEPAGPCPWRDPESDLKNWFPGATGYAARDLILSGKRAELEARLGRSLRPEEMLLRAQIVASNEACLGTVLTRRFKATHGAIEMVLALDPEKTIRKLKIQRIREPAEVQAGLNWMGAEARFEGKSLRDDLARLFEHEPNGAAREVAARMTSEVTALLELYEAGEGGLRPPHH